MCAEYTITGELVKGNCWQGLLTKSNVYMDQKNCYLLCSPTTTAVTVSVLVSGVVSAISTAIVTSIIVWCVMRRPPSPAGTGTADDDKGVTELATVIYDTPHVIKEHNDQSAISTQDNVAYGGTIPLKKQNEDYEQVHIN